MIIDSKSKQLQIEVRDINYILPAYIRSYLFYTRNEDPEKIVFPLFPAVPHPIKAGVMIPIEYVPLIDPKAIDIAQDGADVAEVTPAQEAEIDEKDEEIKKLKEELSNIRSADKPKVFEPEMAEPIRPPASKSKAKPITTPIRTPRMPPGGDIGAGSPDDMGSRDRRDLARAKQDMKEEPEIDEAAEAPFDKTLERDEKGNPVIKE